MGMELLDWWARHRITTRIMALTVLSVWAWVAIRGGDHFEAASWVLGGVFVAITFGINAIDKVAALVRAWKCK